MKQHPLLGLGAVVGAGAMLLAACGSSGNGTSAGTSANTTIPGAITTTTSSSSATHPTTGSPSVAPKGLYGALPSTGTPSKGGTVSVGFLTGATADYIFPITPAANSSVYNAYQFQNLMWLPLYDSPTGATPKINYQYSLAKAPVFSDGDKVVTIPLNSGYRWSDGKPVTANDVVFMIDLVKAAVKQSAANWGNYSPGFIPDNVKSATTVGQDTVVLHLTKAYNPNFFLDNELQGLIFALPSQDWNVASANGPHLNWKIPANAAKIVTYLQKIGGEPASFATNPLWKIVDGPFKLTSFSATNDSFTMVPNPTYGGPVKPSISQLQGVTETGITPMLNALKSGTLDIGTVDFSQLGQVDTLRKDGYSVFGYPDFGWYGAIINFEDKTDDFNKVIAQPYVRQAMAHLVDQPGYLTGIYKNAGSLGYGPVPSLPTSPYTPADAVDTPYPFSTSAAASLLTAHGWKVVPNGATTCQKPGTASDECGAGIPKGTPIKFTWFYLPSSETPSSSLESEAFASEAKQVGIQVQLVEKTFNYLTQNFDDANPADAKYINQWGVDNFGGFTDAIYPTTNTLFNTGGSFNFGGYSDPTANSLISASVYGSNPLAVRNEASYITKSIPVLFMPLSDLIWAVSDKVGGTADSFLSLTQYTLYPQYWYLNK